MSKKSQIKGVSLIICCHNSADKLPSTLKHVNELKVSSYIPWELIIVDNASSDGTSEIAAQLLSADIKNISKIVIENALGLRDARLRGIAESHYDYISFIDDDNWINPEWINVVNEIMSEHPEVGACGGVGLASFESEPPLWFEQYQECFAVGPQGESTGYIPDTRGFLWGAGLTIRRSAWEEIINNMFIFTLSGRKGTNLSSGEDSEICLALRCYCWRLWYDERLTYYHYLPSFRLGWDYLKRMQRGFGACEVVLGTYRELINSTTITTPDFNNAWIADARAILKTYQNVYMLILFLTREGEGSQNVLGFHGRFGHLLAIVKLRNRYDEIKKRIFSFYQNSKLHQEKVKAIELLMVKEPSELCPVGSLFITGSGEPPKPAGRKRRNNSASAEKGNGYGILPHSWRLTAPLRKMFDAVKRKIR